ncbi:uncharacterized protein METZ01_LOCUS83388, partial [marine metagenome]
VVFPAPGEKTESKWMSPPLKSLLSLFLSKSDRASCPEGILQSLCPPNDFPFISLMYPSVSSQETSFLRSILESFAIHVRLV